MTLSEQFTVLMKRKRIDRLTLGKLTGFSQPTIRKILNDDESIKLGYYIKTAQALDSSIKYTVD